MYKIGELSRLCRIPVKTLRYYDNEGVLVPDEIDRFTGYRYYSAARIAECNRIISLKELGFSLEEIKKHLQASTDKDILALVDAKCAEIEEKSKELSLQLRKLNHIRKSLSEGERIMFPVAIRSGDTIRVACERKRYGSKEAAEEEAGVDDAILLDNLHLIDEEGYLIRAAMLAFYKDTEKWVTGSYIKIGYFGKSDADLV